MVQVCLHLLRLEASPRLLTYLPTCLLAYLPTYLLVQVCLHLLRLEVSPGGIALPWITSAFSSLLPAEQVS